MEPERVCFNVHLVEDSDLFRGLLESYLRMIPQAHITGFSVTAQDAIQDVRACRPDLVVLDMQLESGTGLDVLRAICADGERPSVVILSNHSDEGTREACLSAGALAFFDKTSEFPQFVDALKTYAERSAGAVTSAARKRQ